MHWLSKHFPTNYAAIDLETTGLNVHLCDVIEVGVVTYVDGVVRADSILVNPGVPVPEDVQAITHITNEMVQQRGLSLADAADWLALTVGNLPLVGHNCIQYDGPVLERFSNNHGWAGEYPLERFRDTMALFKGLKMGQLPRKEDEHVPWALEVLGKKVYGLRTNLGLASKQMGVGMNVLKHRAAGDAALTQKLFEKLRAEYQQQVGD